MLKPLFDNLDDEQVDNDNQDSLLSKYFPALKGIKDDKNISSFLSPQEEPYTSLSSQDDNLMNYEYRPPIIQPSSSKPIESISTETPDSKQSALPPKQIVNDGQDFNNQQQLMSALMEDKINEAQRIKDAQQKAAEIELIGGLGRAGEIIGSGISGVAPPAQRIFEQQIESAGNLVSRVKEQIAAEKDAPGSPRSKAYRDMFAKMKIKIPENVSASEIEKIMPYATNIYNQEQARIARAQEAKERASLLGAAKIEKQKQDLAEDQNKAIATYAKKAEKQYETLSKLETAVNAIDLNNIKKTGPSDVAALYSFIRALDPDSVVREGEIALARAGMSLPQKLRSSIQNMAYGGIVDKEYRKEMAIIAKHMAQVGYQKYHKALINERNILKNRYKLTDEDIKLYDPVFAQEAEMPEEKLDTSAASITKQPQQQKTVIKKGYNPTKNQTQLIYSDGTKEIVNGRQ